VIFLFIQAIPDACAVARLIHSRGEAVLLQDLPLLGSIDEIVAFDSEARCFAALLIERAAAPEYAAGNALLDAAFAGSGFDVGWGQRFRRTASSAATTAGAAGGGRRLSLS
jgi:hypothetical protein